MRPNATVLTAVVAGRSKLVLRTPFTRPALARYRALAARWRAAGGTAALAIGPISLRLTLAQAQA